MVLISLRVKKRQRDAETNTDGDVGSCLCDASSPYKMQVFSYIFKGRKCLCTYHVLKR